MSYKNLELNSLPNEYWVSIHGYEGLYEISNLGRVKSLSRLVKNKNGMRCVSERIIKQKLDKDGYLLINLCKNQKMGTYKMHRLVAYAFIQNADSKPQINHINGIRGDNRCENLEWCTNGENQRHAYKFLNKKTPMGMKGRYGHDPRSKPVVCVNTGERFVSAKHAARLMNIHKKSILYNCHGKQKSASGYQFQFV